MAIKYGTYTENYNLVKPDDEDFYDVNHINENMDIIDEELTKLDQKTVQLDNTVVDISGLIGTEANTGGSTTKGTVMAKLNALLEKFVSGGVGIKSVQRGTFIEKDYTQEKATATTINLSTVVPSKTFIIINGGVSSGYSGSSTAARGYIGVVTATNFTYYSGRATATITGGISWQAVEFY